MNGLPTKKYVPPFIDQCILPKDQVAGYHGPRMVLMTSRMKLVIPLVATLFAGSALAQESRDPNDADELKHAFETPRKFSDRPITVQLRGGIDTLVGLIGLTAAYDVENHLALGVGAGTNGEGLQLAVFARVRPFIWESRRTRTLRALAFEGSFSTGPGVVRSIDIPAGEGRPDPSGTLHWSRVSWIQGEVVYEVRTVSGFSFTVGSGVAVPIHSQGPWCSGDAPWCSMNSRTSAEPLPTVTVGVGHDL